MDGQYRTAKNLETRIAFQRRFSENRQGFGAWLMEQYPLAPGARVLEVGCGEGGCWRGRADTVAALGELVLTDLSEGMLARCRENLAGIGNIGTRAADIQAIPFEDGRFDIVIANMMLYHVPDRPRALAEVRRVLRPGGLFFAATFGERSAVTAAAEALRGVCDLRSEVTGFTLQNGAEQLRPFFAAVERRDYPDCFLLDDAQALVDYLLSLEGMLGAGFPADAAREAFQRKIEAEGGVWRIPKEYGTFVCRKEEA